MKNPARKKSVQSGAFRRKHSVVQFSDFAHISRIQGYLHLGGTGMYFRGIAADSKFQEKMKGTYLRHFTVFIFTSFYE